MMLLPLHAESPKGKIQVSVPFLKVALFTLALRETEKSPRNIIFGTRPSPQGRRAPQMRTHNEFHASKKLSR